MGKNEANQTALEKANKAQDNLDPLSAREQAGELITGFEGIDTKNLQQINADYFSPKENSIYDMMFTGMTEFTNEKGTIPAVELVDKESNKVISAMTVIVNTLKKVTQFPCFVRIATKTFVKTPKGKYLDMDIYVLPQTIEK